MRRLCEAVCRGAGRFAIIIPEGALENKVISESFSEHLLNWYRTNRRDLPWRRSRDPYRVWVSEIMLQQTRVETAAPYFERFMERFPTLEALADAPEEEVLKLWEGLGYYSRARNLHEAVREVRERYGGRVPDTPEELGKLKGVGPYTVGAILCIAYGRAHPAVDGNVMRVLARYFCIGDDVAKPRTRSRLERLMLELMPPDNPGDFLEAVMDLGATVCTPSTPRCGLCPVGETCGGRLAGMETELPVKSKAKPPRLERRVAALVTEPGGGVLIRRRPERGLLAGMWELPHFERPPEEPEDRVRRYLEESLLALGVRARAEERLTEIGHTFSHVQWELEVYTCRLAGETKREPGAAGADGTTGTSGTPDATAGAGPASGAAPACGELPPDCRWLDQSDLDRYVFPKVFLSILERHWT